MERAYAGASSRNAGRPSRAAGKGLFALAKTV
jgi:hypothetical protein